MSKQSIARQGRTDSEVSQAEKDLAQKALKEFNSCNYSNALNVLLKLEELRPNDIKLQHNKAVCEFFKSGLTNVDAFHKALHDIITQCSKGKGHGRGPDMPTSNEPTLSLLNLAVVYYHQLNYGVAIDLLSPLYVALESLDETVGMRVCLLLISAHLLSSNAEEAQNVIQRTRSILLPQPLPSTGDDTPVSSPHHDSCHGDSRNLQASSSTPAAGGNAAADSSPGYNSGATESGAELSSSARGSSTSCREASIDQEALRLRLQLLSVRALLCLGQPRPAAKEMKAAIKHAASSGNQLELSQICLKSQVRFVQRQGVKAIKVLNTCTAIPQAPQQPTSPSVPRRELPSQEVWYNNNLALLHWSVDRPAAAYFQLEKAIDQFFAYQRKQAAADCPPSLYNNYATVNLTLCYNMACARLHFNKSISSVQEAFNLFMVVQQMYPRNPRIWVHLAECCIAVHRWRAKEESATGSVGVRELGSGQHSKLLLCPAPHHIAWPRSKTPPSDSASPEPKLPFARLCLENALKLLPASNRVLDDMEKMSQMTPAPPSLPMRPEEVRRLRCVALCCAAYTDLGLHDYVGALQHATNLICAAEASVSHFSAAHYRYLGHLYAAEACIFTNKMGAAAKHLEQAWGSETKDNNKDAELMESFDEEYFEKSNIDAHEVILKYNLSVVYALRQDFEKAQISLDQVWNSFKKIPLRVVMVAIYLQLKQGNIAQAQDLAIRHLPHIDSNST